MKHRSFRVRLAGDSTVRPLAFLGLRVAPAAVSCGILVVTLAACGGSVTGPGGSSQAPTLEVTVYKGSTTSCSPYPCTPQATQLEPTAAGEYLIEMDAKHQIVVLMGNVKGKNYHGEIVAVTAGGTPARIFGSRDRYAFTTTGVATPTARAPADFWITLGVAQSNPSGRYRVSVQIQEAGELNRDLILRTPSP